VLIVHRYPVIEMILFGQYQIDHQQKDLLDRKEKFSL
jgi:hypothetical protein